MPYDIAHQPDHERHQLATYHHHERMIHVSRPPPPVSDEERKRVQVACDHAIGHDHGRLAFMRLLEAALAPPPGGSGPGVGGDVLEPKPGRIWLELALQGLWQPIGRLLGLPERSEVEQACLRTGIANVLRSNIEQNDLCPSAAPHPRDPGVLVGLHDYLHEEEGIVRELEECLPVCVRHGITAAERALLLKALHDAEAWGDRMRAMMRWLERRAEGPSLRPRCQSPSREPDDPLRPMIEMAVAHACFGDHYEKFYRAAIVRVVEGVEGESEEDAERRLAEIEAEEEWAEEELGRWPDARGALTLAGLIYQLDVGGDCRFRLEASPAGMRLERLRQRRGYPRRGATTGWTAEVRQALAGYVLEAEAIARAVDTLVPDPDDGLVAALEEVDLGIGRVLGDLARGRPYC